MDLRNFLNYKSPGDIVPTGVGMRDFSIDSSQARMKAVYSQKDARGVGAMRPVGTV
jgi:hypothetical protein